jgi:hypothetical protein
MSIETQIPRKINLQGDHQECLCIDIMRDFLKIRTQHDNVQEKTIRMKNSIIANSLIIWEDLPRIFEAVNANVDEFNTICQFSPLVSDSNDDRNVRWASILCKFRLALRIKSLSSVKVKHVTFPAKNCTALEVPLSKGDGADEG